MNFIKNFIQNWKKDNSESLEVTAKTVEYKDLSASQGLEKTFAATDWNNSMIIPNFWLYTPLPHTIKTVATNTYFDNGHFNRDTQVFRLGHDNIFSGKIFDPTIDESSLSQKFMVVKNGHISNVPEDIENLYFKGDARIKEILPEGIKTIFVKNNCWLDAPLPNSLQNIFIGENAWINEGVPDNTKNIWVRNTLWLKGPLPSQLNSLVVGSTAWLGDEKKDAVKYFPSIKHEYQNQKSHVTTTNTEIIKILPPGHTLLSM